MSVYQNPPYYLTAYGEAVRRGFVGTVDEWLASLVGPEGPQGIPGPIGPEGPEGPIGPVGPTMKKIEPEPVGAWKYIIPPPAGKEEIRFYQSSIDPTNIPADGPEGSVPTYAIGSRTKWSDFDGVSYALFAVTETGHTYTSDYDDARGYFPLAWSDWRRTDAGAALPVKGTYIGDGVAGQRDITLGFEPSLVMIFERRSSYYKDNKFFFIVSKTTTGGSGFGVTSTTAPTGSGNTITAKGVLNFVSTQAASVLNNFDTFASVLLPNGFRVKCSAETIAANEGYNLSGFTYEYIAWR